MSDYVHSDRRSRGIASWTLESRATFAACYLLFLLRAVLYRVMPWRRPELFGQAGRDGSIFREAHNAASVLVTSSFMGL
jgi:hypothetical protein